MTIWYPQTLYRVGPRLAVPVTCHAHGGLTYRTLRGSFLSLYREDLQPHSRLLILIYKRIPLITMFEKQGGGGRCERNFLVLLGGPLLTLMRNRRELAGWSNACAVALV